MTGKRTLNKFNKTPLEKKIFKEGIKELQINFELKEFSTDRAKLYYRKFKEEGLTNWMFTRIKEHILEREKFFPVISVFYSYLEEIYEEINEIENFRQAKEYRKKRDRVISPEEIKRNKEIVQTAIKALAGRNDK